MSYFKDKTHQIRFRLGLCSRHRWEAYSAPPDPLAGFKGLLLKGRRGGNGRGRVERKGLRGGKRKGEEEKG